MLDKHLHEEGRPFQRLRRSQDDQPRVNTTEEDEEDGMVEEIASHN